jgi:hypothetical protein
VTDTLCFPWDLADKKRRNKGSNKASDFPTVAQRTTFFESRINSKDSEIRKRVLTEVGYFYSLPDQEYRSFLKQLYWDADPCVRGMAIKKLYDMWVPQDPSVLPKVFTGYHCGQLIDTTSATCTADLISQCSQNNLAAGYAAYVLGLLRAEEAIPSLTNLLNHSNIFVRYTAARALFDCGDQAIAVATFDDIASQQLILYESLGKTSDCPVFARISPELWYAACACRALIAAGGEAKRRGVARLIQLMGCLQRSTDVNDQSNLHWVRGILAEISNQYFVSAEDAAGWFKQQQETKAANKLSENTDTATSDPQR